LGLWGIVIFGLTSPFSLGLMGHFKIWAYQSFPTWAYGAFYIWAYQLFQHGLTGLFQFGLRGLFPTWAYGLFSIMGLWVTSFILFHSYFPSQALGLRVIFHLGSMGHFIHSLPLLLPLPSLQPAYNECITSPRPPGNDPPAAVQHDGGTPRQHGRRGPARQWLPTILSLYSSGVYAYIALQALLPFILFICGVENVINFFFRTCYMYKHQLNFVIVLVFICWIQHVTA